jgi:hypothetical protein
MDDSMLPYPRIAFRGLARINVATGNNALIANDSANVTLGLPHLKDTEYASWLQEMAGAPGASSEAWNYYGDGAFSFDGVVTGVQTAQADGVEQDVVGDNVSLGRAVMVDLDPRSRLSTQVFARSIAISGRAGTIVGAVRPHSARHFNVQRIPMYLSDSAGRDPLRAGGAIFQARIPAETVRATTIGSGSLMELARYASDGRDLFLQYALYNSAPTYSPAELLVAHRSGEKRSNPHLTDVAGFITCWPGGAGEELLFGVMRPTLAGIASGCGPALVWRSPRSAHVTLDFSNALGEADGERARGLEKVLSGTLRVFVSKGEREICLGEFRNSRADYESSAGLVDIHYDREHAALVRSGLMSLRWHEGPDLMREAPACPTISVRAIYLDEGCETSLRLGIRSSVAGDDEGLIRVWLQIVPSAMSAGITTPIVRVSGERLVLTTDLDGFVDLPSVGHMDVRVHAVAPGAAKLMVSLSKDQDPRDPLCDSFALVRVLPEDLWTRRLAIGKVDFATVYDVVLRYYHLLYPGMSIRHCDLSNELAVARNARLIRHCLDFSLWETPDFMPSSRDLSKGKRELLLRYLDQCIEP